MVHGEEAGARLDLTAGELTIFETDAAGAPHFSDSTITTEDDAPHRSEQRHFIETITANNPLRMNTVEQALTVQRVMGAIYRSSEAGTDVELDVRTAQPVK